MNLTKIERLEIIAQDANENLLAAKVEETQRNAAKKLIIRNKMLAANKANELAIAQLKEVNDQALLACESGIQSDLEDLEVLGAAGAILAITKQL